LLLFSFIIPLCFLVLRRVLVGEGVVRVVNGSLDCYIFIYCEFREAFNLFCRLDLSLGCTKVSSAKFTVFLPFRPLLGDLDYPGVNFETNLSVAVVSLMALVIIEVF
jgi:hypothetical protein